MKRVLASATLLSILGLSALPIQAAPGATGGGKGGVASGASHASTGAHTGTRATGSLGAHAGSYPKHLGSKNGLSKSGAGRTVAGNSAGKGNGDNSSYYYGGNNLDPRLRKQGYRSTGYGSTSGRSADDGSAVTPGVPGYEPTPTLKKSGTLDKGHPKGYIDHVQP